MIVQKQKRLRQINLVEIDGSFQVFHSFRVEPVQIGSMKEDVKCAIVKESQATVESFNETAAEMLNKVMRHLKKTNMNRNTVPKIADCIDLFSSLLGLFILFTMKVTEATFVTLLRS